MSISFGTKIPTFLNILVLLKVVGIRVISLVLSGDAPKPSVRFKWEHPIFFHLSTAINPETFDSRRFELDLSLKISEVLRWFFVFVYNTVPCFVKLFSSL